MSEDKNKLQTKKKEWYEKNKTYNKEYYETNKAKILEKVGKKDYCQLCNTYYCHGGKSKHNKTKRHIHNVANPNDLKQRGNKDDVKKEITTRKPKIKINESCIIISHVDNDINHELITFLKQYADNQN